MMRVAVQMAGKVEEPYLSAAEENALGMFLRPGFIEMGLRRSAIRRVTLEAGEIRLCARHMEKCFGSGDLDLLTVTISDAALTAACNAASGVIELRSEANLEDARVRALVAAVDAERVAGFPSGRLFLDSVEQALGVALVAGYAVRRPSRRIYRGGLAPICLRRVTEFVHEKVDDDLSLEAMADVAGLSIAHFSQMFRQSTGQSPHQFVLRHRVERAKEILRNAETRVLDVAVACGFKTQQHFARVFRQVCGLSPTEYRQEFLRQQLPMM